MLLTYVANKHKSCKNQATFSFTNSPFLNYKTFPALENITVSHSLLPGLSIAIMFLEDERVFFQYIPQIKNKGFHSAVIVGSVLFARKSNNIILRCFS